METSVSKAWGMSNCILKFLQENMLWSTQSFIYLQLMEKLELHKAHGLLFPLMCISNIP